VKKALLIAMFALALTAFAGIAQADVAAVDCAVDFDAITQHGDVSIDMENDGDGETLEQILAQRPEDPQTKAIDSGICCSDGCPTVSGYGHFCGNGSCWYGSTCMYYRK